jgi:hypothetical protein
MSIDKEENQKCWGCLWWLAHDILSALGTEHPQYEQLAQRLGTFWEEPDCTGGGLTAQQYAAHYFGVA